MGAESYYCCFSLRAERLWLLRAMPTTPVVPSPLLSPSQESCCLKGGVWCLCLRMCVCVCVFVCVTCLYISFEQVDTHAGIAPKRMHALYTVTVNFANLHTTHNVAPHTHTRTHTHAYSRTHTHTRTHARTHTYTCTHINMLTHTHTHTHMHTPLQV